MSEHTPGPWEYSDRTYLVDGKMYKTGDWAIMGGSYCLAQVAKETDARLIAAAPDMAAEIERLKAERAVLLEALGDCSDFLQLLTGDLVEIETGEPMSEFFKPAMDLLEKVVLLEVRLK